MGNAHYELARGSDEDNQKYCKKGGDILLEIGTPAPKNGTNTTFTDAHQLAKLVAEGQDLHDLLNSDDRYTRAYDKQMQFVDRMIQINTNKIGEEAFKNHYGKNQFVMYQWQAELYDMLTMTEPDARKIYWYVDTKGGAGKSTFYSLFKSRGNSCARFRSGRPQDIAYVYKRERVVFFDIPRAVSNILDLCSLMEQFKDGELFSSKYMSEIKCFAPPHVVVFSNHYPPNDVFSDDRLVIKNINI